MNPWLVFALFISLSLDHCVLGKQLDRIEKNTEDCGCVKRGPGVAPRGPGVAPRGPGVAPRGPEDGFEFELKSASKAPESFE